MVGDDEYELLPHEEIQRLRNELDNLKKNPLGSTEKAKDLQTSIIDLTKAINSLTTLLTDTNSELTEEFSRTSITEQFSQISAQNEQIAQGILTVAQMLQDMSKPSESVPEQKTEPQPQAPMAVPSQETQPGMQFSSQPHVDAGMQSSQQQMPPQMGNDPMASQSSPDPFLSSNIPPPALDLPPAPAKKKSGLMGMFK